MSTKDTEYVSHINLYGVPILTVPDIYVYAGDGNQYLIDPQEDITSYEAIRLSMLLTTMHNTHSCYDVAAYIDEHKLHRHFKRVF